MGQGLKTELVSVVIPAYNGAAFIGEALATVFAQTLLPREVIVVDDASSDDTAAVVEALAQDAPVRIRLIRLRKNSGGPTYPMNVGVEQARSPLVALLDQDDLLPPDRLERQVKALVDHPEAGLACGRFLAIDGQDTAGGTAVRLEGCWAQVSKEHRGGSLYWIPQRSAYAALLRFGNIFGGASSLAFPRAVWRQVRGFDASLRICWDLDFAFRVAARRGVLHDTQLMSLMRKHGGNLSNRMSLGNLELARVRWKHYRSRDARRLGVDCESTLSETTFHLAYEYREHGRYAESAGAYLAHFFYGSKLNALSGLARLALVALRSKTTPRRTGPGGGGEIRTPSVIAAG